MSGQLKRQLVPIVAHAHETAGALLLVDGLETAYGVARRELGGLFDDQAATALARDVRRALTGGHWQPRPFVTEPGWQRCSIGQVDVAAVNEFSCDLRINLERL